MKITITQGLCVRVDATDTEARSPRQVGHALMEIEKL